MLCKYKTDIDPIDLGVIFGSTYNLMHVYILFCFENDIYLHPIVLANKNEEWLTELRNIFESIEVLS